VRRLQLALIILACAGLAAPAAAMRPRYEARLDAEELYQLAEAQLAAGKMLKARDNYRLLRDRFPASPRATLVQLRIADSLFESKNYDEAAVEYQLYLDFHPASLQAAYAHFQFAVCRLKEIRAFDRDLTDTHEAVSGFRRLLKLFPDSEYAAKAQEHLQFLEDRLAAHDLYIGRFYYRTYRSKSALPRLESALTAAHSDELKAKAAYYIALAELKLRNDDHARAALRKVLLGPPTEYTVKAAKLLQQIGTQSNGRDLTEG